MCNGSDNRTSLCEFADLYVLGAGSAEEVTRFEQHLTDCARCKLHLQTMVETLGSVASAESPRPQVRQHLLERIRKADLQDPSIVFQAVGVLAKRAQKLEWKSSGLPGVFAKTLFADTVRGYHTSIVKLEPGTTYPPHRHAGIEEIFVLEGDLHYDEGVIVAGDYCRAEPETLHSSSHTEHGCVLLVSASTRDQLLPA